MRASRLTSWRGLLLFLGAAHVLYAPAWQAGWVRDVTGWLESLHTQSAADYLLRRGKVVQSFYPATQEVLWAVWKVLGVSPLAWHLLMVSLHALCAWGWMRLARRLLEDGGVRRADAVALFTGLFVLLSPYATEVVVWEAGFHYLQGMLLQLGVLGCVIRWVGGGRTGWVWAAAGLFLPAVASLEVFYLTPLYTALVLVWYRRAGRLPGDRLRHGAALFLGPQLALCAGQYALFRRLYSRPVPHIGRLHAAWMLDYVRKPAKYLFHVGLNGRYWPQPARTAAYRILDAPLFLALFYGGLAVGAAYLWRRRKAWSAPAAAGVLAAGFAAGAVLLVVPLHFHEAGYVYFDRYAYFLLPPAGMLLGLGLSARPAARWVRPALLLTNAVFLLGTVLLWRRSDVLSRAMLAAIPPPQPGETTVLLNLPNALRGVPMIGAAPEGEAALMRRYVLRAPFPGPLYEPSACNLRAVDDDAVTLIAPHAQSLRVSLQNQEGWWSGGVPTADWEAPAFRVHVTDPACCYELSLAGPPARYQLLLWRGGRWQRVAQP